MLMINILLTYFFQRPATNIETNWSFYHCVLPIDSLSQEIDLAAFVIFFC